MASNGSHAARYVRMSTDMQQYSLENQREAIARYAARRGLTIVRSYEDAGRSGLRIEGRGALKALIDDVGSGRADYSVILVYDVSRWGRFQDSDESAHYEFMCKKAGVTVEYCAEQFANDGSLTATVIKNIKRAMAAEYSRELSVKVHAGQSRLAAMGFRRGGEAGYGLRRCLVDAAGKRKAILKAGEWKNITTDRVILVPGPPHEVEIVNRIYRMFVHERLTIKQIVARLNAEGETNAQGRPWLPTAVRMVLSNEKYIGNNVFNRTSVGLNGKWRRNPRAQWVRAVAAFEPIVPRDLFDLARIRHDRHRAATPSYLLDVLSSVWCRYGTISLEALRASKCAPHPQAYHRCFGGLKNAYAFLGFVKPRVVNWGKNKRLRTAMNEEIVKGVRERSGEIELLPRTFMMRLNGELSLSTSVVRRITTKRGSKRWIFGYKTHHRPDVLIVARVMVTSEAIRDYFCLPYLLIGRNWLNFADGNERQLGAFRIASVACILDAFARAPIQRDGQGAATISGDAIPRNDLCWNGASAEEAIARMIGFIRSMVADGSFADLLFAEGLRSMPRVLAPQEPAYAGGTYCGSLLDFAVVWRFMTRLMAHPSVAAYVQSVWPMFATELKLTYLSILTKGPLARLPSAMVLEGPLKG